MFVIERTIRFFKFSYCLALVAGFLGLCNSVSAQSQTPSPRPLNVLFIAVDDLNVDLGCYGHPLVKTPNIDRLAKRGMLFERAYCQFSLCSPSRTSFLSGRRPDTTRIVDNETWPRKYLGNGVVFLPEHFQANGYFTARVGKMMHQPFESAVSWNISEDAPPPLSFNLLSPAVGKQLAWEASNHTDAQEPDGGTALRVAELITQHANEPFFIGAGFLRPHLPFVAPKRYFSLYPLNQIQLPADPVDDRNDIPPVALTYTPGGWQDQLTTEEKLQATQAYFACISFIDAQIGIILDTVQRLGLNDNTVIILVGDHGFHLGEHQGLWRKQTLFEQAARAPFIIAAPGKRAGAICYKPVEFVDIYPTLTSLCNLPTPDGLQGQSLVSLLEDANCAWPKAAFTQQYKSSSITGRSVRTEQYRYSNFGATDTDELYDLQSDPNEYTNLARNPAYAAVLDEMKNLLKSGPVMNGQ